MTGFWCQRCFMTGCRPGLSPSRTRAAGEGRAAYKLVLQEVRTAQTNTDLGVATESNQSNPAAMSAFERRRRGDHGWSTGVAGRLRAAGMSYGRYAHPSTVALPSPVGQPRFAVRNELACDPSGSWFGAGLGGTSSIGCARPEIVVHHSVVACGQFGGGRVVWLGR